MPRAVRDAADSVNNAAEWISTICQAITTQGIDITIHRTDDGHLAVNVKIPLPKEPASG